MPQETNAQVVCRWFQEMWNERRLDTVDRLLTPNVVAHEMIGPESKLQGRDEFRAAAKQLLDAFSEIHFKVEDVFSQDDRVAIRLTVRIKHTGSLGGLPGTGRTMTLPVMCIVRLENGLLAEGWNSWDVAAVLRTAGAPQDRQQLF